MLQPIAFAFPQSGKRATAWRYLISCVQGEMYQQRWIAAGRGCLVVADML